MIRLTSHYTTGLAAFVRIYLRPVLSLSLGTALPALHHPG
jgi:hypothetical protein